MKRLLPALFLLFTACELGPDQPISDDVSVSSRADNGACPSQLRTGKLPGEACTVSGDCAEVCCSCSGGGGFAAAACVNGQCATNATVCSKALENKPEICP